jgi:glycosyltransferase involved in cell wall biosynthesis
MRVLYTSPVLEHPAAGGPQLRVENSIKALSTKCKLDVFSRAAAPRAVRARTAEYFRAYSSEFRHARRLEGSALADRVRRKLRRTFRDPFDSDTREDAQQILELVDLHGIGIVWFGYGNISFPLMRCLRALRPRLKLVCDTDSVWSRFVLRELPYATGLRKLRISRAGRSKEREERAWVELCDVTTGVSEVDAEYYRGLTPHQGRIHLFPNVIDVESYRSPPARSPGFRNPSIYLAGTFGYFHSPMDTATRWVLEKVMPRLLQRIPDLHFYIVGNNSDKGFGHLNGPNITATGRLDSVLPYLCHADVALVPLHFESGTRFKILEAGACGVPLVSTTLGAEGIPVVDGREILIADQPEAFADAIVRLIEDKAFASRLAANCRQLVRDEFSLARLARDAQRILAYLERIPAAPHAG